MRHLRDMSAAEVQAFLNMLANEYHAALAPSGQSAGHVAETQTTLPAGCDSPL